jgi:hypothetical protein
MGSGILYSPISGAVEDVDGDDLIWLFLIDKIKSKFFLINNK